MTTLLMEMLGWSNGCIAFRETASGVVELSVDLEPQRFLAEVDEDEKKDHQQIGHGRARVTRAVGGRKTDPGKVRAHRIAASRPREGRRVRCDRVTSG